MLDDILKLIDKGTHYREVSRKFDIPYSSLYNLIKFYKKNGKENTLKKEWVFIQKKTHSDEEDKTSVKEEIRTSNQEKEIKNLRSKYNKALKLLEDNEARQEVLSDLENANSNKIISTTLKSFPKISEGKRRAIAFMLASDFHVEEVVDPTTINYLNDFNLSIAEERIKNYFKNAVSLINKSKIFNQIDTLVFAILGDMISGYIHDELIEDNACSPTQAIIFVDKMVTAGIHYILDNVDIKELIIPCCFGNHGRTNLKRKVSSAYKNSYEWLMYKNLQEKFKSNEKITFIVENGYLVYLSFFDNYTVRLHHGDNMRYLGGVGGLTIPVNKSIAQWNKIKPANLDCFGHFHQLKDGGNWICNGSLIGYSAFALSIKADFEEPKQAFFLIDEEKGKTLVHPIFCS